MVFTNKKGQALVIGIVAIVLVAVAIIAFSGNDDPSSNQEVQDSENQSDYEGNSDNVEGSGNEQDTDSSNSSSSSGNNSESVSGEEYTVEMSASGFTPQQLTIEQGDTVVFENTGDVGVEPAVDLHPTHTQYDGTSRSQHCQQGEPDPKVFDACSPVQPDETYEFTFDKTGEWGYHDHTYNPGNKGTIIVE